MKRVLLSSHNTWSIYNFRFNLIKKLINADKEVHIYSPIDNYSKKLTDIGCIVHKSDFSGRSKNIFKEFYALLSWILFLKRTKFDICLHFGIKPNIYGSIASIINNVPYVNNITGLGDIFIKKNILQIFVKYLYLLTQNKAKKVFFQNKDDLNIFIESKIIRKNSNYDLLPGSGVDLNRFKKKDNINNDKINFFFVGRLLKSKGIELYISAAKKILKEDKFKNIEFFIVGFFEENASNDSLSKKFLDDSIDSGFVKYLGKSNFMEKTLLKADCVVLPSFYREGTPRILLESCAMGIPIITTNSVGCRNVIDDKFNGFMIKPECIDDLKLSIEKFASLTPQQRIEMGVNARNKVELEFDENIVINKYFELFND
tara:strand:+ start:2167 stop:3282 length:1116 start_codon:yes stop_codon:yes gene_type:complete